MQFFCIKPLSHSQTGVIALTRRHICICDHNYELQILLKPQNVNNTEFYAQYTDLQRITNIICKLNFLIK